MITQIKTNGNSHVHHQQQMQQQRHELKEERYSVNLKYTPTIPEAGRPTLITIEIIEKQTRKRIKEFDILHEKLIHVIIVSEDLSHFSHIHPVFNVERGIFTVYHVFPEIKKYKIWVDFKPKNADQTLVSLNLDTMIGTYSKSISITKERQFTKQIDKNYYVNLLIPKEIKSNKPVDLTFVILDQNSNPITDLTPLMGAGGHSVIISSNLQEFLHVHPTKEVSSNWKGGPEVSFNTVFPHSGLYKAWGQFQHQNVTITADFVLEVV